MENKKIKNTKDKWYNNVHFKSSLEVMTFKTLEENGLSVQYEPTTFTLWEGFKPTIPFYTRNSKKLFIKSDKKEISIKYTPDFVVINKTLTAFIEAKGKENDVFYIKRKLFRKYLEDNPNPPYKYAYFIIKNKKELLAAINIIKNYEKLI